MNLQQILDEVRAWPLPWELNERGHIRSGCDCPLSIGTEYMAKDALDASNEKSIDRQTACDIMGAADRDGFPGHHDPSLRRQLLEACGLTEAKP